MFAGWPSAGPEDIGSSGTRYWITAGVGSPGEVNVDFLRNGLFRIPVILAANFVPTPVSGFPIVVTFADFAGRGAPIVATAGPPGGIFFIPEPSAATLLALPSFALLRRRRAA